MSGPPSSSDSCPGLTSLSDSEDVGAPPRPPSSSSSGTSEVMGPMVLPALRIFQARRVFYLRLAFRAWSGCCIMAASSSEARPQRPISNGSG